MKSRYAYTCCEFVVNNLIRPQDRLRKWACDSRHGLMLGEELRKDKEALLPRDFYDLFMSYLEPLQRQYTSHFIGLLAQANSPVAGLWNAGALQLATALFTNTRQVGKDYVHHRAIPFEETFRCSSFNDPDIWKMQGWQVPQCWVFDYDASQIISNIIRSCGLDPTSCTHTELEAVDPFVICMECYKKHPNGQLPVFNWVETVRSRQFLRNILYPNFILTSQLSLPGYALYGTYRRQ